MSLNNDFTKSDHREQYEYARARLRKRKGLMRHFIFFLAGSILFLIMDLVLGFGKSNMPSNWSAYLILFWFFILLVHSLNVLLLNRFMDKEWEDRQVEKLKSRQIERILELQQKVNDSYPIKDQNTETQLKFPEQSTDSEQQEEDHSRFKP